MENNAKFVATEILNQLENTPVITLILTLDLICLSTFFFVLNLISVGSQKVFLHPAALAIPE
ncbi:hypothetical protein ED210_25485 [Escherichia coli]|nr:hypothetical protein [Escherichia coli]